jgi:2-polyprenyl-3-methyl-5-hydroxy-6-metoxy-1,4-benzoquinol methylase
MPPAVVARLFDYVGARHPRSLPGVLEARALDPERFDELAALFLDWARRAFGEGAIESMTDAFVRFSMDVNFAQARYEAAGHYEHKSYQECQDSVYSQDETMDDYLSGIYLTNFLWAHHLDLSLLFEERFVARLPDAARIVEIASGHGGWGLWALHAKPRATLTGFDISPKAIEMSTRLAEGAGMADRARYALQNVMELDPATTAPVDACICSFLIEHLEQPDQLLSVISALLRPGGTAFLTGALTAAQVDHIYEFRFESELVQIAERHGLRTLDMRSAGPARTLRGARFLPRSAALVLQKRVHETW